MPGLFCSAAFWLVRIAYAGVWGRGAEKNRAIKRFRNRAISNRDFISISIKSHSPNSPQVCLPALEADVSLPAAAGSADQGLISGLSAVLSSAERCDHLWTSGSCGWTGWISPSEPRQLPDETLSPEEPGSKTSVLKTEQNREDTQICNTVIITFYYI